MGKGKVQMISLLDIDYFKEAYLFVYCLHIFLFWYNFRVREELCGQKWGHILNLTRSGRSAGQALQTQRATVTT